MGSEWILGRLAWRVWIGFDWLRTGAGCYECGDEPSGSCATELVSWYIIFSPFFYLLQLINKFFKALIHKNSQCANIKHCNSFKVDLLDCNAMGTHR
jgi:hypothetical protein